MKVKIRAGCKLDITSHNPYDDDFYGEDWGIYEVADMDEAAEQARAFGLIEVFGSDRVQTEEEFVESFGEDVTLEEILAEYDNYIEGLFIYRIQRVED